VKLSARESTSAENDACNRSEMVLTIWATAGQTAFAGGFQIKEEPSNDVIE
jgi:hypothetical protein